MTDDRRRPAGRPSARGTRSTASRRGCCRPRRTPRPRCWPGSSATCSPAAGPAWAASTTCSPRPATAGHPARGRGRRRRRACSCATATAVRMFANTCRHRGHELLPEGEHVAAAQHPCARTTRGPTTSAGALIGAPGFRDVEGFDAADHGLVELPVRVWQGWVFGHALHPLGSRRGAVVRASTSVTSTRHRGAVRARDAGARRPAHLRGRGELEGDRRELPRVLPLPADPPGAVPGQPAGLRRQLRPARVPGSAARWTCATAWRRCR